MNLSVFINGYYAGGRPYGYASFSIDVTDYLNINGDNTIAVKVDNSEQPNSPWYSGCGIYRNVRLRQENDVCIPKDGTYITTSGNNVNLVTTVENTSMTDRKVKVITSIYDGAGRKVASSTTKTGINHGSKTEVKQTLKVKSPTSIMEPCDPHTLYRQNRNHR